MAGTFPLGHVLILLYLRPSHHRRPYLSCCYPVTPHGYFAAGDSDVGIRPYTVGSLRANVQVGCLVDVIEDLVSSEEPQHPLKHLTQAFHEVFACSRSKKHMIQRQLGRFKPTTSLKYRASEIMRNLPMMST
jgi:hypothetical protein